MKKWLNKIALLGLVSMVFVSCEKDEVKTVLTAGTPPSLSASATTLVLLQANAANNAVTFTWTEASFGFDAAISYELQISKAGTSFAPASTTSVAVTNVAPLSKLFKVVDFNKELLKIINHSVATQVEVRLKATVAAAAPAAISNVVTMTVTAYRDIISYTFPNALNIAGNFQGWNPGSAPQIVNQVNGGYNGYEGYIVFNDASPQFKMVKGNNWGAGDFGSAGGNNLTNGGANLTLPSGGAGIAGYWRIRADLTASPSPGQWYWDKINTWGIIGGFNGWGSSVAMNFDPALGTWTITRDMPAGEFKFRANNDWAINMGDNNNDGKPEYNGGNLNITAAGNYTITLDLGVGGNYAYILKKN